MIAFPDHLPMIQLSNGNSIAFDRDWLARALNVAAVRCGYTKWWLAPHVAASVHQWLETLESINVMPVAKLTRAVRAALQVIGYAEVGDRFEAAAPFSRISLVELAVKAGNGFELAFFESLDRRLREVMELGGTYCELHGLEPCVRVLRRKRTRSNRSRALKAEIVQFARERTGLARRSSDAVNRELFLYVA